MSPLPEPTWFASYPGDATDRLGEISGPNALGDRATAVTVVYDPATNRTRVGFTLQRPPPVT